MDRYRQLRRIGALLLVAGALTIGQVVLASMSGRGDSWHERYLSLWTWDGGWYADIINNGYRTASPANAGQQYNVAFFPGYPVTAGIVARCFGLTAGPALLLTSQCSAFIFWFAVLLLLGRWQVPTSGITAAVMLIFCQPGAYYFVVAYSEALFFAAFLVFISLAPSANRGWHACVGASVAGYLMAATRILGAPLAILPLSWAWNEVVATRDIRPTKTAVITILAKHSIVSVCTALGTITFFIYCAVRFGHWNEYMRAGEIGWFGNHVDYSTVVSPRIYNLKIPHFEGNFLSHGGVTRLYIPILAVLFLVVAGSDVWLSLRSRLGGFSERACFYITALLMLVICASSGANPSTPDPTGFIRYGLYTYVPLVLALSHAYRSSAWRRTELPLGAQLIVFIMCGIGLVLQSQFCWLYARGVFVA